MEFLFYQLKLALSFAVLYLFYRLLMGTVRLHAFNRFIVLFSILIACVLLLLVITVHVHMPQVVSFSGVHVPVSESQAPSGFPWVRVLTIVYFSGTIAVLLSAFASVASLLRLISRSERHTLSNGVTLVLLDREDVAPMSWMKYIIMSRKDYDSHDSGVMMVHEMAHVHLGHSWDILLADLFTAFQWFNPAAWMMKSDLRSIHEYQADDAVIEAGIDVKQYQLMLVRKAFALRRGSVANSLNHGELKKRITNMTIKKSSAKSAFRALYLVPLVFAGLAANARTVYISPGNPVPEKDSVVTSFTVNGETTTSVRNFKIYIDGKPADGDALNSLDVNSIDSVNVNKTDGENSEIHVFLKKYASGSGVDLGDILPIRITNETEKSVGDSVNVRVKAFRVDSVKADVFCNGLRITDEEFNNLSPDEITVVTADKDSRRIDIKIH